MTRPLTTQPSRPDASAQWELAPGLAMRLPIGPGPRQLQVTEGRLWLTRVGTLERPAEDIWLQAGDGLRLASGSEWVIEGWSQARFQLLVPPDACATNQRPRQKMAKRSLVSASSWLRRASAWFSPLPS